MIGKESKEKGREKRRMRMTSDRVTLPLPSLIHSAPHQTLAISLFTDIVKKGQEREEG